jgi:dinuclear metal center YbgI/SA1388 family protein
VLVRDFTAAFEKLWPAAGAEEWDRPGLSVGSLNNEVTALLLCVDVTEQVLEEAVQKGASLVLSHHPLIMRGVSSLDEGTVKGGLVTQAIRSNINIFSAHTNADIVENGVSDVIAKRLGLFNAAPLVAVGPNLSHGRVGDLAEAMTIGELADKLVGLLPATARGVTSSASADTRVQRVALCGGAGDSFIPAAVAAGADVYITSDLRHHVTQEAGLPLIDVSHWASESLWLEEAASQLTGLFATEKIMVSSVATDPWVFTAGRTK